MENKPTVEKIKDRFKAYETHYTTLHAQQIEIDNYYELVFKAGVPKRYETRMPSTARDWIDVGVRHFTLDNPKSRVPPRNNSDTAREQVAKLETFYNFWLRKDILKIKDAAKKLPLRGQGVIKVDMDDTYFGNKEYKGVAMEKLSKELRTEYEEKRLFHFPLYLTIPDPINVYVSPAHNGLVPVDVIESYNMTVAEAEALCLRNGWEWKGGEGKKANDKVKWLSYISADYRCFLLGDEPVLQDGVQENFLGFCPYVDIPSGSGQSSYEGKPEYLYRSLIWGKRDMLKMEVRLLSQMDAITARYAWVKMKARGDPEMIKKLYPNGVPTDPDEWILETPDDLGGVTVEVLQGEQPPQGLFQQYSMIQAQAHPPSVLSGVRPQGVYSAQGLEDLMATSKPIYKDAFKNLEDALGVAMGMGAKIIDTVYGHDVAIRDFSAEAKRQYMNLGPDDIKGHYDCEVQLLAEPPEATDVRKALGKTLRQGGSISHKTELRQYEDMSEKEADDELAQIAAENAMQEPAVRNVIALNAMERLGMHKELEQLTKAAQEAKQQITKGKPPIQQSQQIQTGAGMLSKRGRTTPGVESIPSPRETQTTGTLGM